MPPSPLSLRVNQTGTDRDPARRYRAVRTPRIELHRLDGVEALRYE
jgi:hypothetical protein